MAAKRSDGRWPDFYFPDFQTALMSAEFIDLIDWRRPWLATLLPAAEMVLRSPDWLANLNEASIGSDIRNHRGLPVRFVPQADLPPDCGYEAFISTTGSVPTRHNLHDFLNALVWLSFPRVKTRLNQLQAAEIFKAQAGPGGVRQTKVARGKLRDAATIFDENTALVAISDASVIDALREHRWRRVFIDNRATFGKTWDVCLFGHALMEKLVAPYKAITAHAFIVQVEEAFFSLPQQEKTLCLDTGIAHGLSEALSTADFTPLPVLGVPDWWSSQDDTFYSDTAVFRPKRTSS